MPGPKLEPLNGTFYISVGDAITLARMAHRMGASAEQFANTLASLLPNTKSPKPPKKKRSNRV